MSNQFEFTDAILCKTFVYYKIDVSNEMAIFEFLTIHCHKMQPIENS